MDFPTLGQYKVKSGEVRSRYSRACRECFNKIRRERFDRIKRECGIEWKCRLCGYDRCLNALHLHHLDGVEKDAIISRMTTYSMQRILKEIDKCVVLCAICHIEVHAGLRTLAGIV